MRGVGIDDELGASGGRTAGGKGGLHLINGVKRNPGVCASVQAEDRPVQLARHVDRVERLQRVRRADEPPVPGHARLDGRVVRVVKPHDAPAPAKARDAQARGVAAVRAGPGDAGVEVAHHLRVGCLGHDLGDELGDLAIRLRIALAHEEFGRDGQVAGVREAARDVRDVLVHAKDLRHHEHHRQPLAAGRLGAVGGHREAADGDLHLAGDEPVEAGRDGRLRHHRKHRGGKAAADGAGDEAAPVQVLRGCGAIGGVDKHEAVPVSVERAF